MTADDFPGTKTLFHFTFDCTLLYDKAVEFILIVKSLNSSQRVKLMYHMLCRTMESDCSGKNNNY